MLVLIVVALLGAGAAALLSRGIGSTRGRSGPGADAMSISDAEAQARRWTERLGAGVATLDPRGKATAVQARADAADRYTPR